jgi:hypothetical protein
MLHVSTSFLAYFNMAIAPIHLQDSLISVTRGLWMLIILIHQNIWPNQQL